MQQVLLDRLSIAYRIEKKRYKTLNGEYSIR